MVGAGWYVEDAERVRKEMAAYDELPPEEKLAQGRTAYEEVCWAKKTWYLKGIWWMLAGAMLAIGICAAAH